LHLRVIVVGGCSMKIILAVARAEMCGGPSGFETNSGIALFPYQLLKKGKRTCAKVRAESNGFNSRIAIKFVPGLKLIQRIIMATDVSPKVLLLSREAGDNCV